uniref:Cdc23 domain-containing protein n=1 Tax=Glossina palpalis gambiensis TaxID=67801 RepID=A0A1B0BZQ7_9MUSC
MENDFFKVLDAKRELRQGIVERQKHGLVYSVKWLAGMCHGLADVDNYFLAKSYFDVREYDRAAHLVRNASSPVPRFLHLYATYKAIESK